MMRRLLLIRSMSLNVLAPTFIACAATLACSDEFSCPVEEKLYSVLSDGASIEEYMEYFDSGREYEVPFDYYFCRQKGLVAQEGMLSNECNPLIRDKYLNAETRQSDFIQGILEYLQNGEGGDDRIAVRCSEVGETFTSHECVVSSGERYVTFRLIEKGPGEGKFLLYSIQDDTKYQEVLREWARAAYPLEDYD